MAVQDALPSWQGMRGALTGANTHEE